MHGSSGAPVKAPIYYFSADLLGWQSPAFGEKASELVDTAFLEARKMVVWVAASWHT